MNLFSINWNKTKTIIFRINENYKQEITLQNDHSLDSLLEIYLYKIDYNELIGNTVDIKYYYGSKPIQFNDLTTVGEFFLHDNNPIVTIIDSNNIIKYYKTLFSNI